MSERTRERQIGRALRLAAPGGDGTVAERTMRTWLGLGIAGIALAVTAPASTQAQTFVGDVSPAVVTDYSAIDAPVKTFSTTFNHPALLMPGTGRAKGQRIVLIPPGGRTTRDGKIILPTADQKRQMLLVPQATSQRIVLTPPPGTRVFLTPPQKRTTVKVQPAKPRRVATATPAPRPVKPSPVTSPETASAPAAIAATPTPAPEVLKPIPDAIPARSDAVKPKAPDSIAPPVAEIPAPVAAASAPAAVVPPVPTPEPAPVVQATPPAPDVPALAAPMQKETVVATAPPTIPAPPAAEPKASVTPSATMALVFADDDARLNEAHRALLKDAVAQLNQDPSSNVQLLAYAEADNRSKARRLSLSRALAVRSYLLSQDIRNTRIEVRALGDQVSEGKPNRVDIILQRP